MPSYVAGLTALTDTDGPITIEAVNYDGRLYDGSNNVPAGHDTAGIAAGEAVVRRDEAGDPADNGLVGFLGVGMSNARRLLAELLPLMTSKQEAVVAVNAAQVNRDLDFMIDNEATYYAAVDVEIADRGLTPEQIGVVLLYTALAGPTGSIADYIAETKAKLKTVIVDQIAVRYPNVKQVYLVSREFGGWTLSGSPESYAFAQALAIKSLVDDQVNHATTGDPDLDYAAVPWLGWTENTYTWANGLGSDLAEGGTPGRADGLEWLESDFDDGLHQSEVGATKEANLILPEFESGPYAAPWWYASIDPQIIASHKDEDGGDSATVPSYTPTLDTYQVIIIANRAGISAAAEQPVPTGHGATYQLIRTIAYPASDRNRLSVFRGIGTGTAGTLGVTFNGQVQQAIQVVVIEEPSIYRGGTAGSAAVVDDNGAEAVGVTELEVTLTDDGNGALTIAAFSNAGGFSVNPQTGYDEIYDDATTAGTLALEIQVLAGYSSPAKGTKAAGGTFDPAGIAVLFRLPPPKYFLSVTVEGPGTVTSSPAGIDCETDCEAEYFEGEVVTLTAAEGYIFGGWTGDYNTVDGLEAEVTMDAAKEIGASFSLVTGQEEQAISVLRAENVVNVLRAENVIQGGVG